MNDPNVQAQLAPLWCWPWAGSSEAALQPPPLAPGILPEVTMRDFERYLRANAHHYEAFEKNLRAMQAAGSSRRISVTDITPGKLAAAALYCTLPALPSSAQQQPSTTADVTQYAAVAGQTRHVQGEGLVQAMRTVPAKYFTEDFSLSRQGAAVACSGQLISGACIAVSTLILLLLASDAL